MRPPWAGKRRDDTEPDIIEALEGIGAEVERLDRPVDLLVRYQGRVHLLEVEGITRGRKRQAQQLEFIARWEVPIVRSPAQAMRAIGAPVAIAI